MLSSQLCSKSICYVNIIVNKYGYYYFIRQVRAPASIAAMTNHIRYKYYGIHHFTDYNILFNEGECTGLGGASILKKHCVFFSSR